MTRTAMLALLAGCAGSLGACAYYNAMWSAERSAKEARRFEERGDEPQARSQWSRAAVKAESVLARHPRSRWADDALVLRAEALSRAGACASAAEPIAKARSTVSEPSLQARAGLAAAQCALAGGSPVAAERALAEALASEDSRLRSRAEYLAGLAAEARLDHAGAVEHFRRSNDRAAAPARARALLAAGRPAEASAALVDAGGAMSEADRTDLLAGLGAADARVGSEALDRLRARARLPFAEESRLLIADGDRRMAAGDHEDAIARYRQAQAAAPAATEAGIARIRVIRVAAARATTRAELAPVLAQLTPLAGAASGGSGIPAARTLLELLGQIASTPETPGAALRAAELARDSLHAPRLAGQLFLDIAAADPTSLYAAKALVAALPLLPERHDSVIAVLDASYGSSPYTRAMRGEASPGYAAAEDSLARELGVQPTRRAALAVARIAAPLTGQRGPWLDGPPDRRPAAPPAPARPADRPGQARPASADRPVVPERP